MPLQCGEDALESVQSVAEEAPVSAPMGFHRGRAVLFGALLAHEMAPCKSDREQSDQPSDATRGGEMGRLQIKPRDFKAAKRISTSQRRR